ncbi:MAG TPA: sugar ABC transporter permease, partial [Kosmotoga arenicorallina]|nr:sugar ABC transporter permease [Kosmotoga arenicorallina]
EIIKLEYAHTIVAENITDITAAETYAEKAGEIVSECFGYKYNKRYRDFTWYKDFKEAQDNITEGTSVLSEAISELSAHEALLKEKIYDYIHLRFLGTPVTLDEFTLMIANYNKYFQVFNAKYQRASRKISDLLDYPSSYSSQYNPQLKKIDRLLFRSNQIWMPKESTYFYFTKWIMNSIIVALMVALISVTVAALAAYPFSRMRFFGRSQGLLFLLLIQMFPSIMFMIAIYALLQFMGNYIPFLGLNSLSGLIFVYSGGIAFNIWLIKGYFDTIPDTLEESAMIDGATRFQTFWRIVLPLARPILAVIAILTFMGIFNEFVMARIFLQDINKWTYAVGLQQFSGRFETSWGPFTAAALIGAIPMITFFLILQDYIVGGLTKGAVKG